LALKINSKHCLLQNFEETINNENIRDQVPTLFTAGNVTVQAVQFSLVKYCAQFSFGLEK